MRRLQRRPPARRRGDRQGTVAGPVQCPIRRAVGGGLPGQPGRHAADRPWWGDRVFYEVFVRSFADSDGDGIGDLRGLTERLDYLNDGDPGTTDDLGVTALWLMPVAESPSYHGYDVTDYRTVEPDYGTTEDFKALIAAAHARGIDVIVDLVMNHTSIDHPWFQDARTPGSAHDDWYVWSDTDPGVRRSRPEPVWHRDGDRCYYGYFWEGMPDLNLTNPAVTAEIDGIARVLAGRDGRRTVSGSTPPATSSRTARPSRTRRPPSPGSRASAIDSRRPSRTRCSSARSGTRPSNAASYVPDGALDMTFEFGLAGAILGAIRLGDAESLGARPGRGRAPRTPPAAMARS